MNWKNILNVAGSVGSAASPWLGAATGVLGSILGSKSQQKANEANLQMTRETNLANQAMNNANIDAARTNLYYQTAQNMAEAQRGRDFEANQAELARRFNASEAAKAREYASAKNEVARMLGAGLNPAAINGNVEGQAMMPNGSPVGSAPTGSAGTQSLPSSIPMQAGHVEPVMNQLATVGSLLQDAYRVKKESTTALRGQDVQAEIAAQDRITKRQLEQQRIDIEKGLADASTEYTHHLIDLGNEQTQQIRLKNYEQELINGVLPERLQNELRLQEGQIYNYINSVKAQFAAVQADLARIKADVQMHGDSLEQAYKMHHETLTQDLGVFYKQLGLEEKKLDFNKSQRDIQYKMWYDEFERGNEGLQPVFRAVGLGADGLSKTLGIGAGLGILRKATKKGFDGYSPHAPGFSPRLGY